MYNTYEFAFIDVLQYVNSDEFDQLQVKLSLYRDRGGTGLSDVQFFDLVEKFEKRKFKNTILRCRLYLQHE